MHLFLLIFDDATLVMDINFHLHADDIADLIASFDANYFSTPKIMDFQ